MLYRINALCWNLKKNHTQSKNSNTKLTLGFLYEIVFVSSRTKILVRSDTYAFVRNGLPCTKWSLFEMVFV